MLAHANELLLLKVICTVKHFLAGTRHLQFFTYLKSVNFSIIESKKVRIFWYICIIICSEDNTNGNNNAYILQISNNNNENDNYSILNKIHYFFIIINNNVFCAYVCMCIFFFH